MDPTNRQEQDGRVTTASPQTGGLDAGAVDHQADAAASDLALASAPDVLAGSLGEYLRAWVQRVRGGQSGALPIVAGLLAIVIFFQTQESVFLSAGNITNLLVQGSVFVLLGMAEVFVLLLGEIDLSVGFVAGIGAVLTAEFIAPPYNWPWWAAILVGLAGTSAIGVLQGVLITKLRLPSFVVTLAGLLGWEGVLLYLVDSSKAATGGTIRISNSIVYDLVNGNVDPTASWIVLAAVVAAFAFVVLSGDRQRRRSGLAVPPRSLSIAKIVVTAAAGIVLLLVCNSNRGVLVPLCGVPWVIPVVLGVYVAWTFLLGRTRFGRYVYAVGGNAEAARRAGISLTRMRIACFLLAGLTAGMAGIVYASRLGSISNNIDGGTLVLYAVAAAVIGGASLFGGRGKMLDAVLGGIVIATIYNGLGLIGVSAAAQYMVTALVLLAAVTVDALTRRV